MPLAQRSDVETSLVRTLTPDEETHVDGLLGRAEELIAEAIPEFTAKIQVDSETHDPGFIRKVIHVAADAVARVFRNPGAFRQETEGNYSYTLDREAASGLLTITDAELERLGVQANEFGTHSTITDGYARKRYSSYLRSDLRFQYGWPAPDDDNAEVII